MDSWKQYVCAVIICACICSLINQMVSEAGQKAVIKRICGIFLGISILQPLSGLKPGSLLSLSEWNYDSADAWVAEGENLARDARAACIKSACETYILDKAEILGAEAAVEISLNGDLVPVSAEISGVTAPDVQKQLQNILMTDLGIPKENQIWTWNQENRDS